MKSLAQQIQDLAIKNNLTVSTAESCTGGLVSSCLTDISGSSDYIKINFVTYANEAKMKFVGVSEKTLDEFGAVSEQTSQEMAKGLLKYSDIGISTTGIAGPTGGTSAKPVGLMYISIAGNDFCFSKKINLSSDIKRIEMKKKFAKETLAFALDILNKIYGEEV